MNLTLPKRPLGNTGLEVSVLGMGGFHQVEADQETIDAVVERYLDAGGNYIETAKYGDGASEQKLGRALAGRRHRTFLVSKTGQRKYEGAWREINESLEWLRTDHLDVYLFHGLGDAEGLQTVGGPDGALKAFQRAKDEGLSGHIALSSHLDFIHRR